MEQEQDSGRDDELSSIPSIPHVGSRKIRGGAQVVNLPNGSGMD